MHELDDHSLLRQYAEHNSEAAFAALVARHVDKVYSVALRHTRNAHAAEEVTQAVFVILAKKSGRLGRKVILTGWLYETARLTALTCIRSEIRRTRREQEAHMQTALNENDSEAWSHIEPLLDDAMAKLSEADRHAVVLRYFDGKSLGEVGAALGANEDAAKKRVTRAVEKLRGFFTKRGVTLTATVLTAAISANSVQAAPLGLANTISFIAITKGATAGGSTLALVKGAMSIMAWAKAKTATLIGTGFLVACGATVYLWQVPQATFFVLNNSSAQVKIVPAKDPATPGSMVGMDDQSLGISQSMEALIKRAYDVDDYRIIISTKLPEGRYDYIANLSSGSGKALQEEIAKQFGIVGRFESHAKDVLVLKIKDRSTLKITPRKGYSEKAGMWPEGNKFHWSGQPSSQLANWMEGFFKIPVVDETGMTDLGNYTFDLDWDLMTRDEEKLKLALSEVGFELISTNQPIPILIVEKVK